MKVDRSTGRLRHTAKREVAKVKACSELCVTLDTKEGGKKLINWLDREIKLERECKRVIEDRDGNILMRVERVFRRCKEYSEELMNVENERERERRTDVEKLMNQ